MANSGTESNKLKILCIHGYRQNAQSFRERAGAFRKIPIVKKSTELVFITAPNHVPNVPVGNGQVTEPNVPVGDGQVTDNDGTNETGWWFSQEDSTYNPHDFTNCCKGYDESLELVRKTFIEQGPFDGVFSFSQGAAFASLLCGLMQHNQEETIQFRFVILVAGFKSRQTSHEHLYSVPMKIPSLHVYGDTDKVIQKEMSEHLLQYFVEPMTIEHNGGHFIPTGAAQKKIYTEFLGDMLHRKRIQTCSK